MIPAHTTACSGYGACRALWCCKVLVGCVYYPIKPVLLSTLPRDPADPAQDTCTSGVLLPTCMHGLLTVLLLTLPTDPGGAAQAI